MSVRKEYLITLVSKLQVLRIHWRVDGEIKISSGLTVDLSTAQERKKKNPKTKTQSKNTDQERPIQLGEGCTNILAAVPFTGKSLNMSLHLVNSILKKHQNPPVCTADQKSKDINLLKSQKIFTIFIKIKLILDLPPYRYTYIHILQIKISISSSFD